MSLKLSCVPQLSSTFYFVIKYEDRITQLLNIRCSYLYYYMFRPAWGSVVVKALRY